MCCGKIFSYICELMWIAHFKPSLSIHTIWLVTTFIHFFLHFSVLLHLWVLVAIGFSFSFPLDLSLLPAFLPSHWIYMPAQKTCKFIFLNWKENCKCKNKRIILSFCRWGKLQKRCFDFYFSSHIYDYIIIFFLFFSSSSNNFYS